MKRSTKKPEEENESVTLWRVRVVNCAVPLQATWSHHFYQTDTAEAAAAIAEKCARNEGCPLPRVVSVEEAGILRN